MSPLYSARSTAMKDASHSVFYNSIVACIRALAQDTLFSVSFGAQAPADSCDVNLPLILDEQNKALRTLIRGLGDSFAMMRAHHQPELHRALAPQDPSADRLFTLLERERFEEIGSRQYPGVAYNLQQVWALAHGKDSLSRFGGAEQLEFVLSCLCREMLSSQPLPPQVQRHLQPLRGPVEQLLTQKLQGLAKFVHQQAAYAACTLEIIAILGFDTSARRSEQNNKSDPSESTVQTSLESEEAADNMQEEYEADKAEKSSEIDQQAQLSEQAEFVRNTPREPVSEAEELDLKNSDPDRVIDTILRDFGSAESVERKRYAVFDKSGDETCSALRLTDAIKLRQWRIELDDHIKLYEPSIRRLVSRLQQALVSKQRSFWQQDLLEGELDPQRLTRIIIDPQTTTAYRALTETDVRNCAVTLLIDNSRSMYGKPIITAAVCADVITRVLERCGASTEVLGFTTVSMYGSELAQRWRALGCPVDCGRLNNVRHIIYKSAVSSWQRSRENFGLMLDKDILKQNIDGEALLWAHKRMLARPETRRILMVISDGRPSDSYTLKANHNNFLSEHLEQVILQIERQGAVEIVAIGMGHEVSQHYRRSFYLDDLTQLGPVMLSELTRLLRH